MSKYQLPIAIFADGFLAVTDVTWLREQFAGKTDDEIKAALSMVKSAKEDDETGKRVDNPDLGFLVTCYAGWTPWILDPAPTNVPAARVKQVVNEHQPKVIDLVISSTAPIVAKIFDLTPEAYGELVKPFGAEARKELALLILGTLGGNPVVDQTAADSLLNLTVTLGLEDHVNIFDPETSEFTNVADLVAAKEVDADALQNALNSNQQPVAEGIPAENVVLEEEETTTETEEVPATVPAIIVPQATGISELMLRIIEQGQKTAENRAKRMQALAALINTEVVEAADEATFYTGLLTQFDPSTALPSGETADSEEAPVIAEEASK